MPPTAALPPAGPAFPPPGAGPYAGPTGAYRHHTAATPYAGEQVIIDVGRSHARHLVVGAVIGAVLGGPAVVAAAAALAAGDARAGIFVGLGIGLALLAMPAITIFRAKALFRPRHLVFETPGLRWADPRGEPWSVPWSELASVLVHGALTKGGNAREAVVFLHLYPVDESFALRHPGLARHWNTDGDRGAYRIKVSISKDHIPRIDAAMKRFAPDVYAGVALSVGTDVIPLGNRYPGVLEAGPR